MWWIFGPWEVIGALPTSPLTCCNGAGITRMLEIRSQMKWKELQQWRANKMTFLFGLSPACSTLTSLDLNRVPLSRLIVHLKSNKDPPRGFILHCCRLNWWWGGQRQNIAVNQTDRKQLEVNQRVDWLNCHVTSHMNLWIMHRNSEQQVWMEPVSIEVRHT